MSYANWNPVEYYVVNDIVYDPILAYQCIQANGPLTPQQPSLSPLYWSPITSGGGAITGVIAGTGILVTDPGGPTPTINNSGILSLVAGAGVGVSGGQNPTLSNTGVLSATAGAGISITPGPTGDITIASTAFTPQYASYYSTVTQPLTTNAVTPITYTANSIRTGGIIDISAEELQVTDAGVYKFLYSIQADKLPGGGTTADVEVFIAINNIPVPNSSSRTNISNATEVLLTCEYIIQLNANDVIQVDAFTLGTNVRAVAFPALGSVPATPSIITNIVRIA